MALKNIGSFIKNNKTYSPEDYLKEKCEYENSMVGELDKEDNYNCPICKNKGYYVEIKSEPFPRLVDVKCSCMQLRMSIRSLKRCGINEYVLSNSSLDKFLTTYVWQKTLKDTAINYLNNFKEEHSWFYLGGQTGAGKTMLMTAVFKELVTKHNLTGKYMLWNDEIKTLMSNSKRSIGEYKDAMDDLKNVDVLYIDDFLKLSKEYTNEELSIAYEVLNARYQSNRITLITSEMTQNELENADGAVFGRIYERTQRNKYFFNITGLEKNIRKNPMKK